MKAFRQTPEHVPGKYSFHQVAGFTGQPIGCFGGQLEPLLKFMADEAKLDGVELSTWDLDLRRADTDEGARAYAKGLVDSCATYNLTVVSLATHLQGQCLGDRASVKTIQFQGGAVVNAYDDWLDAGNTPPEDNPYYVPDDVAKMSRERAVKDLLAVGRLAQYIGEINGRSIPVSGFVGSAGAWDEISDFPPVPAKCGAGKVTLNIGNRAEYAIQVIIRRFKPVWDEYKRRGVKFGLESHPGEIGAGDIESTRRFLMATDAAGYNGTVGLNFDASHLVWQDVDPVEFIVGFADYIWSVHHKGVTVRNKRRSRAGVLGGWVGFGFLGRFWDFVYASCDRDSTSPEEIIVALNSIGWDGALTLEMEDTAFDLRECMVRAAKLLREIDLTPSEGMFDKSFVQSTDAVA